MVQVGQLRLPQIKSYSRVMPDSCIILHYIFDDEEFKPKIDYFLEAIKQVGIPCEILPQVAIEITKRLFVASQEYVKTVRRCRVWVARILKRPFEKVQVQKDTVGLVEKAFANVMAEIEKKHFRRVQDRINAIRRARVVETSIVLELISTLAQSKQTDLAAFFKRLEDEFARKFRAFCKKQSLFLKDINAQNLRAQDLLSTTKRLQDIFFKKCGIRNRKDVIMLCQAVSRMYETNRWCSVVTTDYGDLVNNKLAIDAHTLLICCDPLYFLYHLDQKLDIALHPRNGAARRKMPYSSLVNFPKTVGVI